MFAGRKGVASDLYIAYCISMFMFLFANIYEVVVSDSTKMLDGFTPAKAGELPCWVDTTWVKTASRQGEGHVSPRLHRCLRASRWWKFVCHGKMCKGLSTSESLGLQWLCFCIFSESNDAILRLYCEYIEYTVYFWLFTHVWVDVFCFLEFFVLSLCCSMFFSEHVLPRILVPAIKEWWNFAGRILWRPTSKLI